MIFYSIEKLCQFFIGFSISILLNDFFERRCPDEYRKFIDKIHNLLLGLSYNCIYCYSKMQIFIFKTKDDLNSFIDSNPTLSRLRDDANKMLTKKPIGPNFTSYAVKESEIYNVQNSSTHFVVYDDARKTPIGKKLFYDESSIDHNNINFEKSTAKFLLIEFKIGENAAYKIDLATDAFDFHFVDNKFTKEFFIYYVKRYLNPNLDVAPDTRCIIKLIDESVTIKTFDFQDGESITLTADCYNITYKQ
jgi:hypothetical protein